MLFLFSVLAIQSLFIIIPGLSCVFLELGKAFDLDSHFTYNAKVGRSLAYQRYEDEIPTCHGHKLLVVKRGLTKLLSQKMKAVH